MRDISFKMVGTSPLLISSDQSSNPLNEKAIELKKLTSIRKKTDEIHSEILKLKWMASLYFDETIGIYMPSVNIWRSIHDSAKMSKSGKDIERGVQTLPGIGFKINYEGSREPEKLYLNKAFVDVRMAKPQGQGKIPVARPYFPKWSIDAGIIFDPEIIEEPRLRDIIVGAGKYCGIGTYRRFFGRYDVEFKD